jgi:hypothetical protein
VVDIAGVFSLAGKLIITVFSDESFLVAEVENTGDVATFALRVGGVAVEQLLDR